MRGTLLAAALVVVAYGRRLLLNEGHVSQQRRDQLLKLLAMAAAPQPTGFVVRGALRSFGPCRRPRLATELTRGASQIHMLSAMPDWIRMMPLEQVTFYFADFRERLPLLQTPDIQGLAKSYLQAEGKGANADDPEVQKELAGAELHPTSFTAARAVMRMILIDFGKGRTDKPPPTEIGEGLEVLELGCGTGLPSLVALRTGADVISTDRSPVSRHLVSHSASLYPSGTSLRHRVVHLDLFDVFERMENPLKVTDALLVEPNIVVANQVFNDDPRLALAVGRFMGAAAAQGAGIIACMEARDAFMQPQNEASWNSFFEAFNEAVKVFHKDGQKLSSAFLSNVGNLTKETVPELILDKEDAHVVLAGEAHHSQPTHPQSHLNNDGCGDCSRVDVYVRFS